MNSPLANERGDKLKACFEVLFSSKIPFVTLGKHALIPHGLSQGEDIDLLVKYSDRRQIYDLFKSMGLFHFEESSDENNIFLYGTHPHDHYQNHALDLHFDVTYELSYRSTNKGEWIPAHEEIQKSIWEDRLIDPSSVWKSRPGKLNEFIHIAARCLLDKREFPPYYHSRILDLFGQIDLDRALYLLSLLFFKFSNLFLKCIAQDELDDIFLRYVSFRDY